MDRGTGTHGGTGASLQPCQFLLKEDNKVDGENTVEKGGVYNERNAFNTDPGWRRVCPGATLCWGMCVNLFALRQYDKSSPFERVVCHGLHLPAPSITTQHKHHRSILGDTFSGHSTFC